MQTKIAESSLSRFIWKDTRLAWFWLIVRLYLGYQWIIAGYGKLINSAWVGENAGMAVKGFLSDALTKTGGLHPDVSMWYASFIEKVALPNAEVFSYTVTFGEILIGLGLIVGCVTGIAAFFGVFLNFNFLLAGTVSANPQMLALGLLLIMSWQVSGYYGLDYFVLPKLFKKKMIQENTV